MTKVHRVKDVGTQLLHKHGLAAWTIQIVNITQSDLLPWWTRTDVRGACCHDRQCIVLDTCVLNWPQYKLRCILLHEIAHALAGYAARHGARWRAIAQTLGVPAWHIAEYARPKY